MPPQPADRAPHALPHGYTNSTVAVERQVIKRYVGPDAAVRAAREARVLTAVAGRLPVPNVLNITDADITLARDVRLPAHELTPSF